MKTHAKGSFTHVILWSMITGAPDTETTRVGYTACGFKIGRDYYEIPVEKLATDPECKTCQRALAADAERRLRQC